MALAHGVDPALLEQPPVALASLFARPAPKEIEALELEQKTLFEKMHAPDYYRQPPDALRADQQRSAEIDAALLQKLERWEILESKLS
jgi:hypothetical protein